MEQPPSTDEQKKRRELGDLMNNFWLRLPGAREMMSYEEEGRYRDILQPRDQEGHSEKWLDQTEKEFFDTIDSEAEKLGLDMAQIRQMVSDIVKAGGIINSLGQGSPEMPDLRKKQGDMHFELSIMIEPLYRHLGTLGYTDKDLNS